jgi:hypothetical protein
MEGPRPERVIEVHASRRAFGRGVLAALERLGYCVVERARGRAASDEPPALRIAAQRDLRRMPPDGVPVLLLGRRCAAGGAPRSHERVVARLRRPAPLAELYRALQLALEKHPRAAPRAAITLPARCVGGEVDWPGAIVSLSEGGCLVRSARLVPAEPLRVWFPLPGTGLVEVAARPVYERRGHVALAFGELADATRLAIAGCVEAALCGE